PARERILGMTRHRFAICAILLAFSMPSGAFGGPLPLSLPIEYTNGQIYVRVGINGGGPRRFVLDSGASGCIVDAGLADEVKLAVHGDAKGTGAGSGT